MAIETTYTELRAKLATLWDRAVEDRETDSVALIALEELSGLLETAHLLRSPRNAERLLAALEQARRGEGDVMSVDELLNIAKSQVSPEAQKEHLDLLEKSQNETLTPAERQNLTDLRRAADQLMLRKAYAWKVLRWRGRRVSNPATQQRVRC